MIIRAHSFLAIVISWIVMIGALISGIKYLYIYIHIVYIIYYIVCLLYNFFAYYIACTILGWESQHYHTFLLVLVFSAIIIYEIERQNLKLFVGSLQLSVKMHLICILLYRIIYLINMYYIYYT